MAVADRLITAEEFERMPEEPGVRMELVRGHVVRMVAPGLPHSVIALRLGSILLQHVEAHGLGIAGDPVGSKLETNPDTVRVPDLIFISRSRLGSGGLPDGFIGAPDLAVEILSPSDRPGAMRAKVAQYLERGARMVWVVDPKHETVTVHEPSREPVVLSNGDVLEGGDVIPGFRLDIRRIFAADPQR